MSLLNSEFMYAPCSLGHTLCISLYARKELALAFCFSLFIFILGQMFMLDIHISFLLGKVLTGYFFSKGQIGDFLHL